MERGAATRGKVAKAIAGADDIEIKATVPHHQIKQALARFGLTANNDEERFIYFFDTPEARPAPCRDHYSGPPRGRGRPRQHREVPAGRSGDVGTKWRRYPDFKIEADASETSMVKSASFSMPVAKGQIKRVAGGKKQIGAIFTRSRRRSWSHRRPQDRLRDAWSCSGR